MSEEISISKDVLPSLDPTVFKETLLGESRGALRQYRSSSGLHIREYEDRFVVHADKVDPRTNPIGHLLMDSPETLAAFGATTLLACYTRNRSKISGNHKFAFSPFTFLFMFQSLKSVFKVVRKLLFG